jgi:hypothetical protein
VDPRVYPGQFGSPPDSSSDEEGVNDLRRSGAEVADDVPADASVQSGGKAPADAHLLDWTGGRQSPRLRCSGSVEFRAEDSDVRMWGILTDISLHGCYVEMQATFPVHTNVRLVLKSFGIRIQARGTVRTSYPFLGMGVSYFGIEPGEQLHLRQLIDVLTGRSAVSNGVSEENGVKGVLGSTEAIAFFDEMAEFFRKNDLLSRDEFHQIAKRVRRS